MDYVRIRETSKNLKKKSIAGRMTWPLGRIKPSKEDCGISNV